MTTDRIWPVGIVIVMAIFIAWMVSMVTISLRHRPQLISDNYYTEGYNLREIREREAAGEATGWQVQVRSLPVEQAEVPLVEMTVNDANGAPCDSLTGAISFYRPSNSELDMPAAPVFPIGAGRYLAKMPRPLERGAWQAVTHLARGSQRLDTRVNFFVEQ